MKKTSFPKCSAWKMHTSYPQEWRIFFGNNFGLTRTVRKKKIIRHFMKIRLIFFLGLTLLLCFGCTSSRNEERLCEIFEQSKKVPEYDEIATFVNSPKFKQICCDELVALDALYPAWRDSVSINFRSLHFYPKLVHKGVKLFTSYYHPRQFGGKKIDFQCIADGNHNCIKI